MEKKTFQPVKKNGRNRKENFLRTVLPYDSDYKEKMGQENMLLFKKWP